MKIARGSSSLSTRIAIAVTLASVLYAASARATDPPNIIVFLADDLGISDLPYFTPPVDWAAIPNTSWNDQKGEAAHVEPTVNRWAARAYADQASGEPGKWRRDGLTTTYSVKPADWGLEGTPLATEYVERADPVGSSNACNSTNTADDLDSCNNANQDILPGFGGLRSLAATGVVFPRFYSNTAKCAPARAAFMTGMYPESTSITQNGSHLNETDITIAEYLKQGCAATGTPIEKRCRINGEPSLSNCECASASNCATAGLPCYRTGLVGKWHLGDKDAAPWNQGFDEYIGFMGGSRAYWATTPLACGPVPKYCANDHEKICLTLDDCVDDAECKPRGLFVGTTRGADEEAGGSYNPCEARVGDSNPSCCNLRPSDGTGQGSYVVETHLGVKTGAKGKDNRSTGDRPCSDTGLTKDADCSYLTRVDRDNARNFIVRNAQFEPFFLVVTFHAVHVAHGAPISTEDHYRTDIDADTKPDVPRYPYDASMYWGSMEEMDAAVGEVLALLDETGVCQEDPSESCHTGCTCMKLGSDGDELCHPASETCKPLSARTAVFFVSDHGRPGGATLYGTPDFRGGKGNVFEGGIRVGLLVRMPGQKKGICRDDYPTKQCDPGGPTSQCVSGQCIGPGICATASPPKACDPDATTAQCTSQGDGPCERLEVRTPVLASGVDLFPTIAQIAGMESSLSGGYAKLEATTGGDTTDGRSFLWALLDPSGSTVTYERSRAFASYPGDGMTVVTHESDASNSGHPVCIYDSNLAGPPNVRRVIAGSCEVPSTGTFEGCSAKYCKVPGRVCLADGDVPPSPTCAAGAKACLLRNFFVPTSRQYGLLRCRRDKDCAKQGETFTLKCKSDVWIQCNGKESNTLWKLRAPSTATSANSEGLELYDLRTNPGEEDQLDCQDKPVNVGNAISISLFNDSSIGLGRWNDCADPFPPTSCDGAAP